MRTGSVALATVSILLFGAGTFSAGESGASRKVKQSLIADKATNILQTNCIKCHDSTKKTAGIDLTTRAFAVSTGALIERDPDRSPLLYQASAGLMPPTGKLPDESIEILKEWVAKGAPYP